MEAKGPDGIHVALDDGLEHALAGDRHGRVTVFIAMAVKMDGARLGARRESERRAGRAGMEDQHRVKTFLAQPKGEAGERLGAGGAVRMPLISPEMVDGRMVVQQRSPRCV